MCGHALALCLLLCPASGCNLSPTPSPLPSPCGMPQLEVWKAEAYKLNKRMADEMHARLHGDEFAGYRSTDLCVTPPCARCALPSIVALAPAAACTPTLHGGTGSCACVADAHVVYRGLLPHVYGCAKAHPCRCHLPTLVQLVQRLGQ